MRPIQTNKTKFHDDKGNTLVNGYIWVGQPEQDPKSFPRTVLLEDESGSQFPAFQPLRTGASGKIVFNGKPVLAMISGDYSLTVETSAEVQVDYIPRVSNPETSAANEDFSYYLTLAAAKADTEVIPGQLVQTIGKNTPNDGLGAQWFVISSTGAAGDDETLFDFENGLQGQIITPSGFSDAIDEDNSEQLATSAAVNALRETRSDAIDEDNSDQLATSAAVNGLRNADINEFGFYDEYFEVKTDPEVSGAFVLYIVKTGNMVVLSLSDVQFIDPLDSGDSKVLFGIIPEGFRPVVGCRDFVIGTGTSPVILRADASQSGDIEYTITSGSVSTAPPVTFSYILDQNPN